MAVLGPNDGDVKLLAPDGFTTQATIDESGGAAAGMFMSVAGVPIDQFEGPAKEFVDSLLAGPLAGKDIDPYSIYGAQAAQVLFDAIASLRRHPLGHHLEDVRDQGDRRAARLVHDR